MKKGKVDFDPCRVSKYVRHKVSAYDSQAKRQRVKIDQMEREDEMNGGN